MNNIIIVGAGGHGLSVLEVLENHGDYKCIGFLDDNRKLGFDYFDYTVLGKTSEHQEYIESKTSFIVAIGNRDLRTSIFNKLKSAGAILPGIISKHALVSYRYSIGEGTIVMAKAYIGPGVNIGDNCIINTGAIIEHDVWIGNNVHVGPGAIIIGGKIICDNATIGAGAVVTKDIKEPKVYLGIPAK